MDESKLKEKVAEVFNSRDHKAIAELIVEYVDPGHVTTDFVSMLLNTRRLNPGDALVKKVRKGIQVRTLVPGSVHLASELTVKEIIGYSLDGADVKVMLNEWELESGHLGTLAEISSEMMAKLKDFYMNKVFTALSSIWTAANTDTNFTSMSNSAVTATALKNAINTINQTTRGARAIVGVRSVIQPIADFGAFHTDGTNTAEVPSQIEEVMRTGMLGSYYGVPLIALDQEYDYPDDYNALLPADKLLVIGENVGEFIVFGDMKTKQWVDYDPTPPYLNLEVYQQFGMIIDKADGIFVIGDIA